MKTFTGSADDIEFDFTPEPPLTENERIQLSANYPTTLAYLHVYLDGRDAAELVPSGYLLLIVSGLLRGFVELATDQATAIKTLWYSDPWRFDLTREPASKQVHVTLHVPNKWVAIRDVTIPLARFGLRLIQLAEKWEQYLDSIYREEMTDADLGKQYRLFHNRLVTARQVLREIEAK